MGKLFKFILSVPVPVVSLLLSIILFFICGFKEFLLYLTIQFVINSMMFWFRNKETKDNYLMIACFSLVFSFIEFILMGQLAELDFINISILLILFSLVYFVYWNNKSNSYIIRQKPILNIVCDVLTSIVFFVFVSIATPNPFISTVNNNAGLYLKNILEGWVLACSIIVSLIVYFIVQRKLIKKNWEYVLGNLASFFLLVFLLLLIANLFSNRSYVTGSIDSIAIYLFFLPIRLCITDKMKIDQKDIRILFVIISGLIVLVLPLTIVLSKDASGKGQGLLGLALFIWGIPKLLTLCQDKVFSYLDLKDKNGSGFKINRKIDAIVSTLSIGYCIILFTLSLKPIVLNSSSKDSFSDKFAIAYRVLNSVSIGIIVTTMIVALSVLIYSKKEKIYEKMKCLLDHINSVLMVNVCSITLILGLVSMMRFLGKTSLNSEEFLELYKWSLLILVPMILKALPLLINTMSNGKLDSFPEAPVYSHFRNVVELNLFCLFFVLYLPNYFCKYDLTDHLGYFVIAIIVTNLVIHLVIFDWLAKKIGESNNSY